MEKLHFQKKKNKIQSHVNDSVGNKIAAYRIHKYTVHTELLHGRKSKLKIQRKKQIKQV